METNYREEGINVSRNARWWPCTWACATVEMGNFVKIGAAMEMGNLEEGVQLWRWDLACVALLLDEEKKRRSKRNRIWVHEMLRKRKVEGEFATLYRELIDNEMKFYKYFRMSVQQFTILLSKVHCDLAKRNTTFTEAVTRKEKLAACLRLVAYFIS
ncbi:hypothetical protein Cfor_05487 [Coptotermes formosanus]|uniref:Uncharacterized protein n=1 Tax=Coptotermes formosanus TaxID=36987 RepID=A0A6L2PTJ6_COPFO|nr:hypothetical protein Cfor_05487 [Coptotermes formosanus]